VLVKGLAIFTTSKANNGLSISSQVISCPRQVWVGEGPNPSPTLSLRCPVPPQRPITPHYPSWILCWWTCQDRGMCTIFS